MELLEISLKGTLIYGVMRSTFRTYSFTGHCFRHHVRKNKKWQVSHWE